MKIIQLTSDNLQTTQHVLERLAHDELSNPMTDYSKLNSLIQMIKDIDTLRRETWNTDKFEAYKDLADSLNHLEICSDDIPF